MSGTRQGYVWDTTGICLGHVRDMSGTRQGFVYDGNLSPTLNIVTIIMLDSHTYHDMTMMYWTVILIMSANVTLIILSSHNTRQLYLS